MSCNCSYKKIKSVCSFVGDGDWIESKDQSESGIRLIQTGNIGNGVFKDKEDKAKFISSDTFSELGCTEIFEGDCLISRLPDPIGRCCILPKLEERTITAVDCTILRFNEAIIPQYFVYYSQSRPYSIRIQSKTTASTRKRISRKNLENIDIPIPSLEEQKRIVSELNKINELIRLKKEQLSDYDKLAQSLFYEMFGDPVENEKGWEVKKLLQIVSQNCSISYGIVQPGDNVENGVPVVRPIDLISEYIYPTDLKRTTQEISNSYKRSILNGNEILMCVRGTTGVVSLATDALKGCNVTRGISPIQIGENGNRLFMYYQLKTEGISSLIAEKTYGATLKQINMKDLRELPLILPPLPLQQLFAQRIELIEQQKAEIKSTIADLETLLASRMQYWFE